MAKWTERDEQALKRLLKKKEDTYGAAREKLSSFISRNYSSDGLQVQALLTHLLDFPKTYRDLLEPFDNGTCESGLLLEEES